MLGLECGCKDTLWLDEFLFEGHVFRLRSSDNTCLEDMLQPMQSTVALGDGEVEVEDSRDDYPQNYPDTLYCPYGEAPFEAPCSLPRSG